MVLAAGLGTRLRPLTDLVPKPLVPVGDRPALAHVLDRLGDAGAPRVVVNAHHGLEAMRRFVGARSGVALSPEADLLGTAGGVARAAELLGPGDVLVWNADILAEVDPRAVVAAHAGPRDATLVVERRPRGEGSVGVDASGAVVRLRAERVAEEEHGAEFLGVHVIGEALRRRLPDRGCLVGDLYIPAMRWGAVLRAWEWGGGFFDIGRPDRYLAANLAWLAARGLSSWVAPGARVAPGVTLRQAVVGEGVSIGGTGAIERCVVWPGASAEAPLADAVVAAAHLVRVPPC